jgi:HEAT repeat
MLRGLDDPPWGALSHAYGPADDIPEVIRAVASADEDEADAAVDELFGSVFHQETVFSAAVAAVPFIAELALAPEVHHRSLLVYLLGAMADPAEAYGPEVGAVHAAVTAEVPRLLPLLADPDPGVRETAAYTLAQCPDMAGPIVAELRQHWAVEDVPLVRASLLGALGHLDPTGCAGVLSAALGDPHPAVRAAAALAIVWAELPWPEHGTGAVISAYGDLDPLRGWVWAESDSLDKLLERFDDIGDVPATVLGALVHAPSAQVRTEAADAISHLNRLRRSAPAQLVPLLSPLLSDDDETVRLAAAGAVRTAGSAGALVSDDLAALAAASPLRAESDRRDPAVEALRTLIKLGDPRWREPPLAAWRTGQAPYDAGEVLSQAGVAFDPELLAAVRERLVRVAGDSMLAYNERVLLVWLLGSWGPAAAPAIPELLVALEHGWGTAPRALMAIGPAAAAALPALRAVASQGEVGAALAVWRLAGEPDPLLHVVGQAVDHDKFCASAIDQLLELGEHARPLLGSLRRFLTGQRASTFPAREAQMAAARAVWRLTADPDAVLPTIQAVLAAGDQPAATAARLAAELGSHALPLVPILRGALDDHWVRVDAAHALWQLGGVAAELVGPLLAAVADGWGHGWAAALDLLVDMRAIQAVPRLRELAEQDARILTGGSVDDIVSGDERLQARLFDAIERLQA